MSTETLTMRARHEEIVITPRVRGYSVRRYYDPATGQFISVDPAVDQTEAPYAYANGDPVNADDPLGLGGGLGGFLSDVWGGFNHYVVQPIAQHPVWVAIGVVGVTFGVAGGVVAVAALTDVFPAEFLGGIGGLEGLDALHVGLTAGVVSGFGFSVGIGSFAEAYGYCFDR